MARTKQTAKKSGIPRKNTGGKAPVRKSNTRLSAGTAGATQSPAPKAAPAKKVAKKSAVTSRSPSKKVKRRAKSGFRALREIRNYQSSGSLLVPRTPVVRLAKEIMAKISPGVGKTDTAFPHRFAASAIVALQEAMEIYLGSMEKAANLTVTLFRKCKEYTGLHTHRLGSKEAPELLKSHVPSRSLHEGKSTSNVIGEELPRMPDYASAPRASVRLL